MAAPVLLTYIDVPGATPATWTVPPGTSIKLNSVSATFNGAAATGNFFSCLAVYSQDNRLIGRFFPSTQMATGDSGEVTYAPF